MARPQSITDEEILEAAREVFLEQGPQVPTSEIAARAGISEGTIYRRFETKEELFEAAMGIAEPDWFETIRQLEDSEDLEDALVTIADEIVDFFFDLVPKMTMMMSSGTDHAGLFKGKPEAPPIRAIKVLSGFFAAQQKAGRVGDCDPEIVARMFLGTLFHFVFTEYAGINDFMRMPRQTFVRGVVASVLDGIASEE